MSDFQNGFGFGVPIGLGFAAAIIALAPNRYVSMLDRATFKYVWVRLAMRAALARLLHREPSTVERNAAALLRTRVDSAIARRSDPRAENDARGMAAVVMGCCAAALVWHGAVIPLASLAMFAIAIFVLRLEGRHPSDAARRAAALRPRPPFDPALAISLGCAAVLIAGALGLAAVDATLPGRLYLAVAATFGALILGAALRLVRRPAAIWAEDVAIDAYVDEQLRVTRVLYLLVLSLCPIAIALIQAVQFGADGTILRATYEAGIAIVLVAWFTAGMRAPRTAGT